jgi:hypothetical protein
MLKNEMIMQPTNIYKIITYKLLEELSGCIII